ncbi:MAG TPA: flagellar M-ring protein FliF [Rhodobacterales bacterium]|nr:flagellar M-ring protein FliF [Rhodobacterales bacterium]
MAQLLAVWNALDMRKRLIVVAATVAMFAAVLGLARVAAQPSMSLLYAGLEPGAAGEVMTALEARGVTSQVRGDAIYVETTRRDELRMTLAAEGLPSNSAKGYELLDTLSGFGTTSQMFDAAYWRAKEGELARTIVSSPLIKAARVHIAVPEAQTFRNRSQPSGSVMITPVGEALGGAHAKALKFLVASAVPGLSADNVSIIDARSGVILSGEDTVDDASAGDRAEALKHNISRLLEARVGHGNAVVEVSVDTVTETETIHERLINPEGRVAISTESTETAASSSDSGNAGVTVASNLPSGNTTGAGEASSNNTEVRERINYEVSQTTREVSRVPGAIRRISIAVLVDGLRGVNDAGEPVWEPRPEAELSALRELVSSAAGLDEARGDTVTIKSMEFEPIAIDGTEASSGFLSSMALDVMSLVRVALLAMTALVLGLFVLRPILTARAEAGETMATLAPPAEDSPTPTANAAVPDFPALTGEIDDTGGADGPEMAVISSDFGFGDDAMGGLPALPGKDPVERLRALIEERQDETIEILRGWMEDDEEETA